MEQELYYITSNDDDVKEPQQLIIDEQLNIVYNNKRSSSYWDNLKSTYGFEGACQFLIRYLYENVDEYDYTCGICYARIWINIISEEELPLFSTKCGESND